MIENVKENSQRGELRDRIIETASEAVTAHGIKSITMDDIAASLSISKRTLYEVFQDKESLLKNYRERDSDSTIEFFKMGIKQGIFRDDVNFAIVNLLVHEQLDLLMNTDICNKYSFLEVYEAIMFTYIRGISTEKGARVLEDFITEYRKQRIH